MKRLLVMRFESSKDAFRSTLQNIIDSNRLIETWWHSLGKVPIMKKGQIPDPDSIFETLDDDVDKETNTQTLEDELKKLKESKGLITVDKSFIGPDFIKDVECDIKLPVVPQDLDPKMDEVKKCVDELLAEMPDRKIVIFSVYADTVNYLGRELTKRGLTRILKYTGADASRAMKKIVRHNFDAGIKQSEQANDYDILVTTDALSEGVNLHRAGVIINYDIPYNPTRVIQRIGRINRINKKVFEKLFIYNFFPTTTGESEIKIKQISTLKMRLINAVVGSDSMTLTSDEKIQSFFKDEYQKADSESDMESWDAKYREDYDLALKDKGLFDEALNIKPRSRVIREHQSKPAIVAFGKKGEHTIFALKESEESIIVTSKLALKYFQADKNEVGIEADKQYDEVFKMVRDTLFAKHPLQSVTGRRADALKLIKIIEEGVPNAKDYCRDLAQIIKKYDGINEGDLKSITQISIKDLTKSYQELKK
jgi:superfamily II DNA/RNA helicase